MRAEAKVGSQGGHRKMRVEAKATSGMSGVEGVRSDAHRDATGGFDIDRRCF
jgi:hypothetical protein